MVEETNIIFETEADEKMHLMKTKINSLENRIVELDTCINNLQTVLQTTVSCVNDLHYISYAVQDHIKFLYHSGDQMEDSLNADRDSITHLCTSVSNLREALSSIRSPDTNS